MGLEYVCMRSIQNVVGGGGGGGGVGAEAFRQEVPCSHARACSFTYFLTYRLTD